MTRHSTKIGRPGLLAIALATAFTAPAAAVVIPASAAISPGLTEDGLDGRFYDVPLDFNDVPSAVALISGPPDAIFLSSALDYPQGPLDSTADTATATLEEYLGSDAASIVGDGDANLEGSVFFFNGFAEIQGAFDNDLASALIDTIFHVGSDDGFLLTIGGIDVCESRSRDFAFSDCDVSFELAGFYDFQLVHYEYREDIGLKLETTFGGARGDAPAGLLQRILRPVVPVPAPGALALLGLGLTGLAGLRLRPKNS